MEYGTMIKKKLMYDVYQAHSYMYTRHVYILKYVKCQQCDYYFQLMSVSQGQENQISIIHKQKETTRI